MEFVLYKQFKNVKFIAEEGFNKIYKATWIDGPIVRYGSKKLFVTKILQLYSKKLMILKTSHLRSLTRYII
jgi:hypothetical protein